jgi:hypothetical protein
VTRDRPAGREQVESESVLHAHRLGAVEPRAGFPARGLGQQSSALVVAQCLQVHAAISATSPVFIWASVNPVLRYRVNADWQPCGAAAPDTRSRVPITSAPPLEDMRSSGARGNRPGSASPDQHAGDQLSSCSSADILSRHSRKKLRSHASVMGKSRPPDERPARLAPPRPRRRGALDSKFMSFSFAPRSKRPPAVCVV